MLLRTLQIPAKSSGRGCNALQMWKCSEGRRERPSLSWNSPSTLLTAICLTVVVGMARSAAVTAQLHNWSYRPNSLKEDLLVVRGFCYRSCFHKWGSTVHYACDLQRKAKKLWVMGRSVCEQGSRSVNSLVWKWDTDLGGKGRPSPPICWCPRTSASQMWPCWGLLRCCVHHSATAAILCAPAVQGKVEGSSRAPVPTAHCLQNRACPVWENCLAECWEPRWCLCTERLSSYTWKWLLEGAAAIETMERHCRRIGMA